LPDDIMEVNLPTSKPSARAMERLLPPLPLQ
jgi:hypothetical protein